MGRLESLRQIENHVPESIRFYHNKQTWCYSPHWHMSYEMIMVIKNNYDVKVGGTHHQLEPGDLIIIPSGTVHEIIAPMTGERYYFLIDRDRLLTVEGMQDIEYCFYPYILVRAGKKKEISAHFLRAVNEYQSTRTMAHSAAHLELSLMLIELARELMAEKILPSLTRNTIAHDQNHLLFVDICSYIANHCTENLHSEDTARMIGYSKCYFERMFSAYVGVSFHDFLVRQRLHYSKRLLLQSDEPITNIAHISGFNSIATFNRCFLQYEGMSPSDYRQLKECRQYTSTQPISS